MAAFLITIQLNDFSDGYVCCTIITVMVFFYTMYVLLQIYFTIKGVMLRLLNAIYFNGNVFFL